MKIKALGWQLFVDHIYKKVCFAPIQVTSINRIPKPKPKVEKPPKNETENEGDKAKTSKSTSEENTTQSEQQDPVEASNDKEDVTADKHDEL